MSWLAVGMFSLIVDPGTVAPSRSQQVSVVSRNRETLAVDWLNELLYQYEATGFLLKECPGNAEPGGYSAGCPVYGRDRGPGQASKY